MTLISQQQISLIEWSPFFLSLGIVSYFLHSGPPPFWEMRMLGSLWLAIAMSLLCFSRCRGSFYLKALLLIFLGFFATEAHRTLNNFPKKAWRVLRPVFASVQGTVREIAFQTKRPTLILGPPGMTVSFETRHGKKMAFHEVQQKVRMLLKKDQLLPSVGDFVQTRAFLMPIQTRVTPYGFDFERNAYFKGIGGKGIALDALEILFKTSSGKNIEALRVGIGNRIRLTLPPVEASVAAALLIGDRSAIPILLKDAFVDAGVAHVLAISGLHLTLVTGLFFFILRRFFCFFPYLALVHDTKKIAACFALVGGFFYLLLSGASISTQRAFLMLALIMGALWLDRGSLSKRTVMIAGFVVLLFQPTALFMPSFHLSFFAVMALIGVYQYWVHRPKEALQASKSFLHKGISYIQGLLLASFTASLATIPFTIYHFHKFTLQSLVANLIIIPLMSFWIMPLALLAFLFMPLSLENLFLKGMGQGIHAMIMVAEHVAKWPGSLIQVPELPPISLALMLAGGCLMHALQGAGRVLGFGLVALSFLPLCWQNPPYVFISEGARVVAVRQEKTLWVTTRKHPTFITRLWAESLGYPLDALHTWAFENPLKTPCGLVGYAPNDREAQRLCPLVAILISKVPIQCLNARLLVTARDTWRQGPHFIYCEQGAPRLKKAKPFPYEWPWE